MTPFGDGYAAAEAANKRTDVGDELQQHVGATNRRKPEHHDHDKNGHPKCQQAVGNSTMPAIAAVDLGFLSLVRNQRRDVFWAYLAQDGVGHWPVLGIREESLDHLPLRFRDNLEHVRRQERRRRFLSAGSRLSVSLGLGLRLLLPLGRIAQTADSSAGG
jgi:hypothetical protein